jgi:predicted membrane channel-forming protein YqfA (hemolysin III family)
MSEIDARTRGPADRDEIIESYPDILTELRLLSTVSTLIFGFLLASQDLAQSGAQEWLYGVALVLIASATVVFLLPVVYHRAQYPYEDWRKFQLRSHFFIVVGTPLLAVGGYMSVALAMWPRWEEASLGVALLPILVGLIVYSLRRVAR